MTRRKLTISLAVCAALGSALTSPASAQTPDKPAIKGGGCSSPLPSLHNPAPLQGKDGAFYGILHSVIGSFDGGIYRCTTTGEYRVLHTFNGKDGWSELWGSPPLVEDTNGILYGTVSDRVEHSGGVFFKITTTGEYSVVHHFTEQEGHGMAQPLVRIAPGVFIGSSGLGGKYGEGAMYTIKADGAYRIQRDYYSLGGWEQRSSLLKAADGNYYGTTFNGGETGRGSVFKLTPKGEFTDLHSFQHEDEKHLNAEGAYPYGPLIQGTDGALYGTTESGGANGSGVFFRITPQGDYTVLTHFPVLHSSAQLGRSYLVLANDGNFYGSTYGDWKGKENPHGSIFRLTPDGQFTTLCRLLAEDGDGPSELTQGADGALYGVTAGGGTSRGGTLFRCTLDGKLSVVHEFIYPAPVFDDPEPSEK